jgi:hypothetical protein
MGLTTIGLAGLLVGILPGALSLGGADSAGPASSPAAIELAPLLSARPGSLQGGQVDNGVVSSPGPMIVDREALRQREAEAVRAALLVPISSVLLGFGLVLAVGRIAVRRRRGNHAPHRFV